jgi:hypothetical protein
MATNDERSGKAKQGDDDTIVQRELEREAREGKDAVGDVGSNRNLSGSSTWETLPDDTSADPGDSAR